MLLVATLLPPTLVLLLKVGLEVGAGVAALVLEALRLAAKAFGLAANTFVLSAARLFTAFVNMVGGMKGKMKGSGFRSFTGCCSS
jgi:hypothetical protein